jgi:4-hydroxybutyrate CoA-transferase
MDWRAMIADKLMSPQEAVSVVKPGDTVMVAPFISTPMDLCAALYERRHQVKKIRIDHPATIFPWVRPEEEDWCELHDNYGTPANRDMINAGRVEYLPIAVWRDDEFPAGYTSHPDVFLVAVSPPDRHGYCSFGTGLWLSRRIALNAKLVIAEVHEEFIRTGGDNYIHISQIDRFCEASGPLPPPPLPPRSEEEVAVTEVICSLVASEIIKDRDTVQIGIGTVSSALGLYLGEKHDLGIQTEIITGGVPTLVERGVVTGRYKTVHPGKVVGSACVFLPPEELAIMDGNPVFELYDFSYTDDIRMLMQCDNLVAVNNALMVDLTGQVASETIGPRVWTGVGGQTAFMIAARYARGGRAVTVLPSSHLLNGQRVSRIVPVLPEGAAVTVPRTIVDYVVTEYGVASLRGKTVRERVGELIAVAHPAFRAELKEAARKTYGVTV